MTAAPMAVWFLAPADRLTMNQRHHWTVQRRLTRAWRAAARWAAVNQLGLSPSDRRRPACMVRVTFPVFGRLRRDPHNCAPTVKAIVDGLVDADVWPDDTDRWVIVLDPVFDLVDRRGDLPTAPVHIDLIPRPELGAA